MKRAVLLLSIFFFLLPAGFSAAAAQAMTEIQPLNFGAIALHSNARAAGLTVAPDGTVTADPAIVQGTQPPQRGEYLLEGYPPNTRLKVTIEGNRLIRIGGKKAQDFFITDYTTNDLVTDSAGAAILYIGATLRTVGNNGVYDSGEYNGKLNLIIDTE